MLGETCLAVAEHLDLYLLCLFYLFYLSHLFHLFDLFIFSQSTMSRSSMDCPQFRALYSKLFDERNQWCGD